MHHLYRYKNLKLIKLAIKAIMLHFLIMFSVFSFKLHLSLSYLNKIPYNYRKISKKLSVSKVRKELEQLNEIITKHDDNYYGGYEEPVWPDLLPISDDEYDALIKRAAELERKDTKLKGTVKKLTSTIGSLPTSREFKKYAHSKVMLSLENAFNFDDLSNFVEKIETATNVNNEDEEPSSDYVVEPKIDGLSVALVYIRGELSRAATRGDGLIGEDIILNAKEVSDIPHHLNLPDKFSDFPPYLEIRGEVYINKQDFETLNKKRIELNETAYSTPRNTAAGSLRQPNQNITRERNLRFYGYSLHGDKPTTVSDNLESNTTSAELTYDEDFTNQLQLYSQSQTLECLSVQGFQVAQPWYRCRGSTDELYDLCQKFDSIRESLDYDIDGAVIKVDSVRKQEIIGTATRFPKWAIAYKFSSKFGITTLLGIDIQVGRTGVLTPVANFEPVNIGGVIVERATLHNEMEINRLNITVGDRVIVERSGDVIPKIKGIAYSEQDIERRVNTPSSQVSSVDQRHFLRGHFQLPSICPVCSSPTIKDDKGVLVRCTGSYTCSAQMSEKLSHFCSRGAADIPGLGPATIAELLEDGYISSPADLYTLNLKIKQEAEDAEKVAFISRNESSLATNSSVALPGLVNKKGWGEKSLTKLLQSIETRRVLSFNKILFGLGIRHVGEVTAKDIAETFSSLSDLMQYLDDCKRNSSSPERLAGIAGVGPKVIHTITEYFLNPDTRKLVDDLLSQVTVLPAEQTNGQQKPSTEKVLSTKGNETLVTTETGDTASTDNAETLTLPLNDKVIVLTGKMRALTRNRAEKLIERLGGVTAKSVTKTTNLLIIGSDEKDLNSTKLKKAAALNIERWTEEHFLDMVREANVDIAEDDISRQ